MNQEPLPAQGPVDVTVRPRCGSCCHIGEHGWGLPYDEKRCLKIKDRQADFDSMAVRKGVEAIDAFRFRPTNGVLPYSDIERCKYYERSNL